MLCVHWEFCISPVQVVSSLSGNIITVILGWITFVINNKIKSKKVILKYNIIQQTYTMFKNEASRCKTRNFSGQV